MKIERMLASKQAKIKEKAVVDTIELTSEICTQRSYRGLLLKMKKALPKFFGFQAVGVLLYDQASKFIFLTL